MMTANMTAMKRSTWEAGDGERIDIGDEAGLERWSRRLCARPDILKAAVAAVGPKVHDVKGYLFVALVKDHATRKAR